MSAAAGAFGARPLTMGTRARLVVVLAIAAIAAWSSGGCEAGPERLRDCSSAIWIPMSVASPRVLGSFQGWKEPGIVPVGVEGDHWLVRLHLPPGEHQYLVAGDGETFVDPYNPLTSFRSSDEREVSLLIVPDCGSAQVVIDEVNASSDAILAQGRFLAGDSGAPLDPATLVVAVVGGEALAIESVDAAAGTWRARGGGAPRGKVNVIASASASDAIAAEPARASAWVDPRARRWSDAIIYQVMIDRYRGDGGAALAPPPTAGSRAGGTLDGVRAELEAGTFERLGVTALWLSPVYQNPDEARPGADGHEYEGYHGYWPRDGRSVDDRLGGEEALDALVSAAHSRGLAVLLDLVPNHVYETHPLYRERAQTGWFHPGDCVCGSPSCPWSEHIRECWFTPYLPDIRWQHPPTAGYAAREARYWLERFDVDGFRVDAVPMMPRAATRRIGHELRTSSSARAVGVTPPFLIGEVYTGPGEGALGQIGAYVDSVTLDSAFDFPLMWAAREVIAGGSAGFEEVDAILDAGDLELGSATRHMGRMLGNHDVARFISVAASGAGNDPWADPPAQPADPAAYRKMAVAVALVWTLPGAPTLYYGDEVGLAGAGDPDSRRVMPSEEELSAPQLELRAMVERLGRLRRCSAALRSAARETLVADGPLYVYRRGDAESQAIVVLDAGSPAPGAIALPMGRWVDALSDEVFEGEVTSALGRARVLLQEGDPCHQAGE